MRARGFWIGLLGLVLAFAGGLMAGRAAAQGVSTTNEVRAMRGLGPIETVNSGQGTVDKAQGPGVKTVVEETGALVG